MARHRRASWFTSKRETDPIARPAADVRVHLLDGTTIPLHWWQLHGAIFEVRQGHRSVVAGVEVRHPHPRVRGIAS